MKKSITMQERNLHSFSIKARLKSFKYAFEGLYSFFAAQHNAIIHLMMTIIAILACLVFRVSSLEAIAVTIAAGFVWSAELFNTAIEKLADKISLAQDPDIKFIKDVSAAAVFVSAFAACLTGVIIFLPKFLQ